MLFNTSYKFLGDSVAGTAVKNTTTEIDYQMPSSYMIYGAELVYENAVDGDYIEFQVVDKDNVLGLGANFVVNEWVLKWFVPWHENRWRVSSETAGTVPQGLYLRLKYTSVGTENDVPVKINFFMIKPE